MTDDTTEKTVGNGCSWTKDKKGDGWLVIGPEALVYEGNTVGITSHRTKKTRDALITEVVARFPGKYEPNVGVPLALARHCDPSDGRVCIRCGEVVIRGTVEPEDWERSRHTSCPDDGEEPADDELL